MKRSSRNLPLGHRPEEPLPTQSDGSLPAPLLDGCGVCYWTDHSCVTGRLQRLSLADTTCVTGRLQRLLCVVGFTDCVIFATLQNLFLTATVQDDFSVWMSRFTTNGGCLHEVSSHQAFSCSRWS